jgi:replicative DNA helicase
MGKTAFALSLAANAAIKSNRAVAFFSLEMGSEQLVQRVLCSQAGINMQHLRQGRLHRNDYKKIPIAAGPMRDAPLYIDDQPGISLIDLKAKCRILKKKNKLDMVIIDYLQLMTGPKSENRQNEISSISRGLKELAKELHIPVLALSQLSRKVEDRPGDGKPMISDLRESGAIEQDADMIWFVYRPIQYAKKANLGDVDETLAELIVAKHRNGPLDDIRLTFIGEHAAFYNYSGRTDGEWSGESYE